jgi:hypothetical protein
MDAPSQFGTEKLIVYVMVHCKTNKDGSFEAAYTMRHLHNLNPTPCSWFAFARNLYYQCELTGINDFCDGWFSTYSTVPWNL